MDTKEDAESQEDRSKEDQPSSPYVVLQNISEEIVGEALQNAFTGNQTPQPTPPAHRRSQSEVITRGHMRTSSFQRLKTQMQKAWRWGGNSREQDYSFNPEVLANQKRQWYQLHSKTLDHTKFKEPTSLFEHFVIVGLHPNANLEAVEDVFARRKKWEFEAAKSDIIAYRRLQYRGPTFPSMEPQILFKYPPGKRLPMRLKDLGSFCFPEGVKTRLLERTPSLSELNELIYGQMHMGRDDLAFIFSLKVADNDTLYGVCLHVTEIVQRPPGILGTMSPLSQLSGRCCRFLVSAPRCYCMLTRVPFFELHYEMLNSIIAQERLNRITQFVSEVSLSCVPTASKQHDQMNMNVDYPDRECDVNWMASAIPVDSAVTFTAAAAGIVSDDETRTLSPKIWESHSPESGSTSEASDLSLVREVEKDDRKNSDDCASESSETRSDALERMDGSYESSQASPEIGAFNCSRSHGLECRGSFDSLFSPVRSMALEDEDDEIFANCEKDFDDDFIMEWARENKNDLLQIVCGYHSMPLPQQGSEIVFQPLEHLQAIEYKRPSVSDLGFSENYLAMVEATEVNAKLAAAEEAFALSIWTTATICRVLSLESVLTLIGVLLEKQVVVVCPNLGVLSAIVLSLVPMIRPFQWQSLFLPILPGRMLDFLDAPVPFIVGIQQKPADLKMKTSNLVHVNVLKDQVKMCHLPALPRYKELVSELAPFHAKLSIQSSIAKKHPVYRCNETQAEAATQFLTIMRRYLDSICSDLRSHTITNVQSNNDRVCLLLKDSFIDSFPSRDRPFIKLFLDTQLFAVLSDHRLSSFEHGSP
ncbi:hypothetical protein P3X46_017845 [Hevea brasiliensis]|uniref:UDENN domain-containing protein n=1 Tax=Hevea brasiliensis TaxID=3981 RepID=A0ABQ9LQ50_HEVBR|nr:uncharacterized protein LOC110639726 [Hevea brasiliensis]XP_057985041.1 uncharacterized protein LOC110639726 [Hevea brasiliensis]XP_057985042.1 uncharacterized protein LOC110639726 [Hevea brasiliensis]KAJ9169683.1 hypothetical protein P3X46_017845 [Hevea brasiliensis]